MSNVQKEAENALLTEDWPKDDTVSGSNACLLAHVINKRCGDHDDARSSTPAAISIQRTGIDLVAIQRCCSLSSFANLH